MRRTRRTCITAFVAGLLLPLAAGAQAATQVPVGCTYATCALRVEAGFWSTRLVRGASGEKVGDKLTGFGGGVEPLLAGPDSAALYGRQYVKNIRRSTVLGLVSAVAYIVVAARTDNFRDDFDTPSALTAVGGAGFVIASGLFAMRARQDLSRGVWWYNAALPH